jgi:hypothetical protein
MSVVKINWDESTPLSAANLDQMEKNTFEHLHDATATGAPKITPSQMTRNVVSVRLSDDYSCSNPSYENRTGAAVSITTTGTRVMLSVRSTWQLEANPGGYQGLVGRISIDSGSSYVYLGRVGEDTSVDGNAPRWGFLGGNLLITGLSAGTHTFALQIKSIQSSLSSYNNCTDEKYVCELIAEEV